MVGAPGSGGQMGFFDAETKLGWGYLRNHLSVYTFGDDPNYLQLEQAMYECLRKIENKSWTLSHCIWVHVVIIGLGNGLGPLLLTWFNFNPSMDM